MFVAVLLVSAGCATTQQPDNSARHLQDSGEKYMAAGETASALKYLTEAEQKDPSDPVIQYDLALAYDQRGMEEQAVSHLKNALKLKPAYPEALNAIGAVYARRGQFTLAQESFQKALNDPFYKTPQLAAYNLGSLHEKRGELEVALMDYQQALKLDPRYSAALYRTGQVLEQLNRTDDARHAYGKAVTISPDLAEAQYRFGVLSYQAGDMEAAAASLSRVGKLAPNTDMADEARRYLERLSSGSHPAGTRSSSSKSRGEVEFVPDAGFMRIQSTEAPAQQSNPTPVPSVTREVPPQQSIPASSVTTEMPPQQSISAPPTPAPSVTAEDSGVANVTQPQPEAPAEPKTSTEKSVPTEPRPPVIKTVPGAAGEAAQGGFPDGSGAQAYKYVIQVGSFVDREKAEEVKNNLAGKGYSASVKQLKHRTLGKVFVIQLQPVNTVSRATTLVAQLNGEIEGEPVILRVPSK